MRSSLLGTQAQECLTGLKNAVTDILLALPGELEQPRDVYKTLGIDRMIGWNIFKLHELDDCFLSVRHIPRKAAFKGFLRAASRQGVADSLLSAAEKNFNLFEDLVELHAGDRPSMEMMLLAYSEEGSRQASLDHRKLAFSGNRYLYGLEAMTRLTISLFEPTEDSSRWKLTLVKGSFGLRRNRPDIPWFYVHPRIFTEFEGQPHSPRSRPLSEPFDSGSLPYYAEFCDCSLPTVSSRGGFVESVEEIFPLETGNAGLMDLVFAEIIDLDGFVMDEDSSTSAKVITPCQLAAMDIIIPTAFAEQSRFNPRVISSILEESDTYNGKLIDLSRSILPIKPGFEVKPTIEQNTLYGVDKYGEIIEDIFRKRDLNPLNYTTIRMFVPFPVIPSNLDISWSPILNA
ncbi:MAG: hypothetical protein KAH31_11455 [Candidatus Sabulitectum sp.]|nr:hypothetical protein [Candidatus Sabulitectum sp.]